MQASGTHLRLNTLPAELDKSALILGFMLHCRTDRTTSSESDPFQL
jgi:hypothetical protein